MAGRLGGVTASFGCWSKLRLTVIATQMPVMKDLPYLFPYFIHLVMIIGSLRRKSWPFGIVFLMLAAVTILDLLFNDSTRQSANVPSRVNSQSFFRHLAFWMWPPVYAAIVFYGLITVASQFLHWFELLKIIIAVGMAGGMLSAPVAHELMHRRGRFDRILAEILMSLCSYTHFCVEHVQGHHDRVATAEDPATARFGESLYAFYPRAVSGGFVSAWNFEAGRLRKQNLPIADLRNGVIRGLLLSALIYTGIGYFFGLVSCLFFAAQSIIGFSIVESINYVQHYGLSRRKVTQDRYEKLTHMHSWNSYHPVSNWFVLNLGHHSDHHCHVEKNYTVLREWRDAPRLPTGLYGMWILALFPPLWFAVMNPLAAHYQQHQKAVR